MRNMVTVQTVSEISPILEADRIEVVRVLGWNVVVSKDTFSVGDKVAYFEIDSFLPESDPRFAAFQARGQNSLVTESGETILGHVLRTARMRGIFSQGLVMGLDELGFTLSEISELEEGSDISERVGVVKWDEPVPETEGIIGEFHRTWMHKTGADRVQNLAAYWSEILKHEWEATVKVDGESHSLLNDGENVRIFGHNWELDSSKTHAYTVAEKWGLVEAIKRHPKMTIQFEYAGPGIHKNRQKLTEKRPFVFSVSIEGKRLPRNEWPLEVLKAATPVLPDMVPTGALDEMIEKVSGLRGNITKDALDEGVVFQNISENPPLWLSSNLNFKIISNKYLVKNKL